MDIDHYFGSDVSFVDGDLSVSVEMTETQQNIIRALLTNEKDYLWHDYGTGIGAYVGEDSGKLLELKGRCISQVSKASGVAASPPPSVLFKMVANTLTVSIQYTDAVTNTLQAFTFNIEE